MASENESRSQLDCRLDICDLLRAHIWAHSLLSGPTPQASDKTRALGMKYAFFTFFANLQKHSNGAYRRDIPVKNVCIEILKCNALSEDSQCWACKLEPHKQYPYTGHSKCPQNIILCTWEETALGQSGFCLRLCIAIEMCWYALRRQHVLCCLRGIKSKHLNFSHEFVDESSELELVGFFCNPNAAATAFDAKILITVKSKGGIQLTTEGRLSALKADLDNFMADCKWI